MPLPIEGYLSSGEVVARIQEKYPQAHIRLESLPKFIRDGRLTPFQLDKTTNTMVPETQSTRGRRRYFKIEEVEQFQLREAGRPETYNPAEAGEQSKRFHTWWEKNRERINAKRRKKPGAGS